MLMLPSQEIHLHELEELVMRGLLCGQLLQQHMQEKSFIEQDHQFSSLENATQAATVSISRFKHIILVLKVIQLLQLLMNPA